MKKEENGNSEERPITPRPLARHLHEYYLPAARAWNLCYYRQQIPPGEDEALGVEAFDYGILTVLHLTGMTCPALEIQSVHVDAGFPLRIAVKNAADFFSEAAFPVRLAYGASLCLLLRASAAEEELRPFCYPRKPRTVTVATTAGLLVFAAKEHC